MGEPSAPNLLGKEERDVVYVPTDLTYKAVKHPQRMGRGDMIQPFTSESIAQGWGARTARDPSAPSRGLLLRQELPWVQSLGPQPSALKVTQQGSQRHHFPLTSCVFSLVPSEPCPFILAPSSPLGPPESSLTIPCWMKREAGHDHR